MNHPSRTVRSACPTCRQVSTRTTYDIGSGPELSCEWCEWCWGADGQHLNPINNWSPVPAPTGKESA